LLAINPYKKIEKPFPVNAGINYPHPFQLACKILSEIQYRKQSQSVIISGESGTLFPLFFSVFNISGSGKTETAKILLNYFTLKNRDVWKSEESINTLTCLGHGYITEDHGLQSYL
jgi:myosin heavy subunit